jgi:hypothetical protein
MPIVPTKTVPAGSAGRIIPMITLVFRTGESLARVIGHSFRRPSHGRSAGTTNPKESTMANSMLKAPRCVTGKTGRSTAGARRRSIDPTTCERDYGADEVEFMQALDRYKRTSGRMFPTCSEILEVIRSLGYVRTA